MIRFRAHHVFNSLLRAGAGRGPRLFALVAVVVPLAYLSVFVASFGVIARRAGLDVQVATLAVVVGGLLLGSLTAKIVSADAVQAGTPENQFYLTRPVSLARLVVARSLGAAALDFWGALFLLPALAAVAIIWNLGAPGLVVAVLTSAITQIGVVALAQTIQVFLVRVVPATRRPLVWTLLALASALSVAGLWLLATYILRAPDRFADVLAPWAPSLLRTPLVLWTWGLQSLKAGHTAVTGVALAALAVTSALAVGVAGVVARWASRQGWEGVGEPWADRGGRPGVRGGMGRPLSVVGKDLRLLLRDRARLVTLLAMPIIFVGIQIFGAAGFSLSRDQPRRLAVLVYSLCAYLAILGPLAHMQTERHAFWILRTVPVSLSRLMLQKAVAWSLVVAAVAVVSYCGLGAWAWGGPVFTPDRLALLFMVVSGVVLVTLLAIAMGCDTADLSRPGKSAVGVSTIYLFLMVAGLFNIALLEGGAVLLRTAVLFVAAVAAYWSTGMRHAAACYDAEAVSSRRSTPGDAMVAVILLFLGTRATLFGAAATGLSAADAHTAATVWSAFLGAVMALSMAWRWLRQCSIRWIPLVRGLITGVVGVVIIRWFTSSLDQDWGKVGWGLVIIPLVEEIIFRGHLQSTFAAHLKPTRHAAWLAALMILPVALAATAGSFSIETLSVHVLMGLVRLVGGSVWAVVPIRVAFVW